MAASRGGPIPRHRVRRGPAILILTVLALLAAAIIATALRRPAPPAFAPSASAALDSAGAFRLTVDATAPETWRFVSLDRGTVVSRNEPWDLAFRRFHIITNGGPGFLGLGGALDLGTGSIDTIHHAPDRGYRQTRADSVHPTLAEWYRYGFTSHLLTPRGRVYAVRTAAADAALVEIAGYYCPGPIPGCVTIRYRLLSDPSN